MTSSLPGLAGSLPASRRRPQAAVCLVRLLQASYLTAEMHGGLKVTSVWELGESRASLL